MTVVAVLIGPELGEIEVTVGGGGLVIDTVRAFDSEGVAVGLLTVTEAVP